MDYNDNMSIQCVNNEGVEQLLTEIDKEINFNELLNKYGSEGLYAIANKLMQLADEDVRTALEQCNKFI